MNENHHCFQLSPLIRGTLITVYLALVLPLPALAPESLRLWLLAAVPFGLLVVLAMLSERVTVTDTGITVGHPPWCSWLLRRGWSLGLGRRGSSDARLPRRRRVGPRHGRRGRPRDSFSASG